MSGESSSPSSSESGGKRKKPGFGASIKAAGLEAKALLAEIKVQLAESVGSAPSAHARGSIHKSYSQLHYPLAERDVDRHVRRRAGTLNATPEVRTATKEQRGSRVALLEAQYADTERTLKNNTEAVLAEANGIDGAGFTKNAEAFTAYADSLSEQEPFFNALEWYGGHKSSLMGEWRELTSASRTLLSKFHTSMGTTADPTLTEQVRLERTYQALETLKKGFTQIRKEVRLLHERLQLKSRLVTESASQVDPVAVLEEGLSARLVVARQRAEVEGRKGRLESAITALRTADSALDTVIMQTGSIASGAKETHQAFFSLAEAAAYLQNAKALRSETRRIRGKAQAVREGRPVAEKENRRAPRKKAGQ